VTHDVTVYRRNTVRTLRSFVVAWALAASAACGADQAKNDKPRGEAPSDETPRPAIMPEKTADLPGSSCGWIPASEVEAVVGTLSGPPQPKDGGCFYPLPLDSIMLAHNARQKEMREALANSGEDLPPVTVDTGGVLVKVSVDQEAGERPLEQALSMVGARTGADSLLKSKGDGQGWDWHGRIIGKPNFGGRAGTLMVTVESATLGMKDEVLAVLAARVRDRVPDLPFRHPAAAAEPPRGPDPCGVLTRAEAEQVLGPLVFAPYPVREGGALADPAGRSCAYYSGRHRALVLTPHFTDGAGELRTFRASSGLGAMGAIGVVDRDAEGADTLEGPWDEVAFGAGGQLAARAGDGMLEIAYLTSSTDLVGATRIAGYALPRLAAATR
jgi:hypothetical protein